MPPNCKLEDHSSKSQLENSSSTLAVTNDLYVEHQVSVKLRLQCNDMNGFGDRPKYWNADLSPSETNSRDSWKDLGTTMNAISFGFVATAILISMFLIMAIFEYLLRPRLSHDDQEMQQQTQAQLRISGKFSTVKDVATPQPSDFSVVMPGQQYPTYLAQPAPLPCQREGMHWPSHSSS